LNRLQSFHLCTDYCIGADGAVQTVVLAANIPLSKVKKVYLDYQSRTSVVLVQVLAQNWWKVSPEWINASENYLDNLEEDAAYVIIGDRVFHQAHRFSHILDLAHEWKEFKGMPFVFAAWASLKSVDASVEQVLNQAFAYGINHIPELVGEIKAQYEAANIDLLDYYTDKISYQFDAEKRVALTDFLALSLKI